MLTLAVLIGLCYIFLFTHIPESLTYFVKILPMLLIIAYTLRLPLTRTPYHQWLIVGLTFCMIGDYTLQWFIVGLSFFLTGHIFYIVAFMRTKQQRAPLAIKLAVTLYAGLMIWWIAGTVLATGDTVLALAVIAYITVIATMGITSFRTGSPLAISAAFLFILSDSILAIDRFITPLTIAHSGVMLTYYGAQLLFALSISQYSAITKSDTINSTYKGGVSS